MSSQAPAGGPLDSATESARSAADSRPVDWLARFGLSARGTVYILMGLIAVLLARGINAEVDQKGALREVAAQPFGEVVVALMGLGFLGYAVWRLSEAAFGVVGEKPGVGPRLKSLARGLIYLGLTYTAVALLLGSRGSQSKQQSTLTAKVMDYTGGRWLVGLVGLIIIGVGIALVVEGLRLTFMRYFPAGELSGDLRKAICQLGRVGTVSRGLVFALVGILVVVAAWTHDASKAGGLDEALKTLRDQTYGPFLLAIAGLGLAVFGVYGLAEARYRRV